MPAKRSLKAQSLIFEQVLLFTMGVIIFIACFAAFSVYQSYFSAVSTNDQLSEVKDIIISNIIKLSQKEECMNSTIEIDIPEDVGGRAYIIELSADGLNITLQGMQRISKFSPLFNLGQSITLNGRVLSTGGKIMIYKKPNEIIII